MGEAQPTTIWYRTLSMLFLLGLILVMQMMMYFASLKTYVTLFVNGNTGRRSSNDGDGARTARWFTELADRPLIPLTKLARSYENTTTCPDGLVYIPDTVLDPALAWEGKRKIPRTVHMTSKNRCMIPKFADAVNSWRFPDHSFFLHDDEAMEVLLQRDWVEFPGLKQAQQCVLFGGAMKADIWRLLVMWEYGGIYTDIDNTPNKFNGTTLQPEDEGFFQIEVNGGPSQWFFAIAPRHPLIYLSVQELIKNVRNMQDVGEPRMVWTTGPGAIRQGFLKFSRNKPTDVAGLIHGTEGHTIRLLGHKRNENEWVNRAIWRLPDKQKMMHEQNMTHLIEFDTNTKRNMSCMELLFKLEHEGGASIETKDLY